MKKIFILILILLIAFLLRLFQLGSNPPSLSWDEASLGYNAYTISTSGQDEHGETLPLARFIAFGDYKPPGYIYAAVPAIFLFGLDEFSVRLPSALAGLVMVFVTYLLVKELFEKETLSLLSAFFIAISPWAIQFSRAAYEANLAACFNLVAVYFFILSRKKGWLIIPSVILFTLSFYTFNANRIIAPLLLLGLCLLYFKDTSRSWKWFLLAGLIGIFMIFPSISYLNDRESRLRFQEVSIFNDLKTVELSNQRIAADGFAWWSKLMYNRRVLFGRSLLKHYFDNFTGRFLFTDGDVNPRLSIKEMGELYVFELPFLILGAFLLIKNKNRAALPVFLWMFIVPVPAATARETPHALRILSILPAYQIVLAYGFYEFIKRFRQKKLYVLLSFLLLINIYYYLHNYYVHYPANWSGSWQYGYKQMIDYVENRKETYDHIFVTDALGRPYIFFAFYKKYPLDKFISDRKAQRDWYGFWNVSSLGRINFDLSGAERAKGKILLVTTENKLPSDFKLLKIIKDMSGKDVFYIAQKT